MLKRKDTSQATPRVTISSWRLSLIIINESFVNPPSTCRKNNQRAAIQNVSTGDRQAGGQADHAAEITGNLFDSWYPSLVRYGLKFSGSLHLAEDTIQETFLLLYRELREGRTVPNPKAWTLLVMRRLMIRRMRAEKMTVPIDDDLSGAVLKPAFEAAEPAPKLCLDVLSPRETEVILLRLQAVKYKDIAAALDISVNSVNKFLARALEKLRRRHSAVGQQTSSLLEATYSGSIRTTLQ